jgi:EAL and modified HD-GYP domain-containing signal transduction protein
VSSTSTPTPSISWTGPTIVRHPVTDRGGRVVAYAARALVPGAATGPRPVPPPAALLAAARSELDQSDLHVLAAGRRLILRVVPELLAADAPPLDPELVRVELPWFMAADPTTVARLEAGAAAGRSFALGDYTAAPEQLELLRLADQVTVDARRADLSELVDSAHAAGVVAVAEHAGTAAAQRRAFEAGADLVQGPWFLPDSPEQSGALTANELQCLHLLDLLAEQPVDLDVVTGLIAADPGLSVAVLRLVNSSVFALRKPIDSVRRATVLVGPRRLRALAVTSLTGSGATSVDDLSVLLTRALTVWDLTQDDSGYTAGLLSAVADRRHLSTLWVVAQSGVSAQVTSALSHGEGPIGAALAAARAHEAGDPTAVLAAGLDPHVVSRTWQRALPEAWAIAQALGS